MSELDPAIQAYEDALRVQTPSKGMIFTERPVDERKLIDIEYEWTAGTPWSPRGAYSLGHLEYNYSLEQWCWWLNTFVTIEHAQHVLRYMETLEPPTKAERELYFSYTGDPLAR